MFKSGVLLTKFGQKILLFSSAQPDYVQKFGKKYLLGRFALCIMVSSASITFLIMMLIFRFSRTKISFDLF